MGYDKQLRMGNIGNKLCPKYEGNKGTYMYNNKGVFRGIPISAVLYRIFRRVNTKLRNKLQPQIASGRPAMSIRSKKAEYKWALARDIQQFRQNEDKRPKQCHLNENGSSG